jgi:hypothetical protein
MSVIAALIGVIAESLGNIFSVIMDWKILPKIAKDLNLPTRGDVKHVRDIFDILQ